MLRSADISTSVDMTAPNTLPFVIPTKCDSTSGVYLCGLALYTPIFLRFLLSIGKNWQYTFFN